MPSALTLKDFSSLIRVTQSTGRPDRRAFDGIDHLLLIVPEKTPTDLWRRIPQGAKIRELLKRAAPDGVPAVTTRLGNKRQTAVHVARCKPGKAPFEQLSFARSLAAAALREKAGIVGVWAPGFADAQAASLTCDTILALQAAAFPMPAFKSKAAPAVVRSIRVLGFNQKLDLTRTLAEAEGNNLTRWLTAQPANMLDANTYAALLKDMAAEHGWQYKRYSVAELTKLGAGAFLAVAQGNADDSACIVRLRYRPGSKSDKATLGLVGKGIIFDTGGTNLKPFGSMLDMHTDMGGSAVVAGTLLALTRMAVDTPIDCWLALTENRTGPTAYKSQDVVAAMNGKTIQTIHTDAEGRMALADTLVLASREKPQLIIDYATLTGTCVSAVTTRYSGVFTNRPDLHPVMRKAGHDSGERVWPFPIGKEFLEPLKSDTADMMQCSPDSAGDHILAASFLGEFVENDVPWIHVDLAACSHKGGLGHVPTEITGFGVRFSTHLLLDKNAIEHVGGSE